MWYGTVWYSVVQGTAVVLFKVCFSRISGEIDEWVDGEMDRWAGGWAGVWGMGMLEGR